MTEYIALLRGINVGCAKRVHMVDLRSLLESLGRNSLWRSLHLKTVLSKPLLDKSWSSDQLAIGSKAAYLWYAAGILVDTQPKQVIKKANFDD